MVIPKKPKKPKAYVSNMIKNHGFPKKTQETQRFNQHVYTDYCHSWLNLWVFCVFLGKPMVFDHV